MSSNNELCMNRPTLIDLNPVQFNYFPFMIILDKCNGSCNNVDCLSAKVWVPSEAKCVYVKVFNMITRIHEAKSLIRHFSCGCKCKFDSTECNSNQKWNNETCQCTCKTIKHTKKIIVRILVHVFARMLSI